MRYVSIDIETTGLNSEWCDIIEFGAILEDTNNPVGYEESPKFHRYLKPPRPEGYRGEIYALDLHAKNGILSEINRIDMLQNKVSKNQGDPDSKNPDLSRLIHPRHLLNEFSEWLISNGYENVSKERGRSLVNLGDVTVAGKNFFSFDWSFLKPLFGDRLCRRSIDPSILWWDALNDKKLPATPTCLERAGLKASGLHTSLGDAWDVILLVRKGLPMCPDTNHELRG